VNRLAIVVGAVGLLLLASCSERGEAHAPVEHAQTELGATAAPRGDLPRLVFFINPHGAPCQVQDRILRDATAQLQGRVEVVRYSTTNPADRAMFSRFGIRALPALVVTDPEGRELRRGPPGIQSAAKVLQLIGG
jgi:thioredoxin-like negative regulator of GroEL